MSPTRLMILSAALAAAPLAAEAQGQSTFRCAGADGKKYYGNTIPPQCYGRLVEQLNSQGMVVRRIDPDEKAMSEKEQEAKEREKLEKEKRDLANREMQRRNRALLATYSSEKDIEEQRQRALADNQKAVKDQEARVADLKKKRASFDKEMEFYQDSKKGGTKLPPKLQEDIRQTDFDLKVQEDSLEVKRKEVNSINAKYDDDKRRYQELSGKTAGERGQALGMDKGVTVKTKEAGKYEDLRNKTDAQRRASQDRAELQRLERQREEERQRAKMDQQRREYMQRQQQQQTR